MTPRGYREEELVTNRASVLLAGGTEDERRTWAAAAARHFAHEGPLVEVRLPEQLGEALKKPRGVVFIPDVSRLTSASQVLIVRCLQTQEERPKLVIGLSGAVENARSKGTLREDLLYRLHRAQVDLTAEGMRDVLAQHRARLAAEEATRKAEAERVAAEKAAQLKASGISMRSSGSSRMRSKAAPRATSPKVTRR